MPSARTGISMAMLMLDSADMAWQPRYDETSRSKRLEYRSELSIDQWEHVVWLTGCTGDPRPTSLRVRYPRRACPGKEEQDACYTSTGKCIEIGTSFVGLGLSL